jgi:hypothetical protein
MDKIYPNPTSLDWNLTTKEQLMLPPQTGSLQQIEEERKIAVALTRYHAPAWLIDLILPVISRSEKDVRRVLYILVTRLTQTIPKARLDSLTFCSTQSKKIILTV